MLNTEQLAYLAGIVDGEGSISITRTYSKEKRTPKHRNSRSIGNPNPGVYERYVLVVAVGMTDRAIPAWLCEEFGGRLNHRSFPGTVWQDRWDWIAASNIALHFLELVLPHLRLKVIEATLAIEFQKRRVPGISLTLAQKQADDILWQSMHELNGRGAQSFGGLDSVESKDVAITV